MRLLILLLLLTGVCRAGEPVDFDKAIAPLFANRCLDCHSGPDAKGRLDLSNSKGLATGGDSGPAVVPAKPADSLMWKRIDVGEMPPKHPLTASERLVLKSWIEHGAKWGSDPIDPFRFTTATRAGIDWWSLQPLVRPAVPTKDIHPIDAFIRARLAEKSLPPSPPTDRRTLIRRLSFDLIGLPPAPAEVERFVADSSPGAYAALVDRLLASPHYGERWARHWLDIAHFGESDGFEYDRMRPNAWRYRDWVIQALNDDMPYDRFAKLQIAGDVLEPGDPAAVVATGFLVGGAHDSLLPAGDALRQIMRQDELEDIVGIVGQSFLGVTVHCARCHDHKFDPVRQADYYRLAAALAGVRRGDRKLPMPVPLELSQRLEAVRKDLAAIEGPVRESIRKDRGTTGTNRPIQPKPLAAWDFSRDLRDTVGSIDGHAIGAAKVVGGALRLDGESYVVAGPLPVTVKEKTFEAWVKLDDVDQRGGGVIGIQSPDGGVFDTLVFGEKEPRRWLAGSEFYRRTRNFEASDEAEAKDGFVHLAVTYTTDGTVAAYRQGLPYGKSYRVDKPMTFAKGGEFQVVFGLRHAPPDGNKYLRGSILRATLYDRALSAAEIAASVASSDFISETDIAKALSPDQRETRRRLTVELVAAEAHLRELKDAKAFAVTPQQPPATHLLKRGNPQEKAELVSAGGLSAVLGSDFSLNADAPEAERRRRLAAWIANERNPLFARTMVNRVWQYHFGRGLVDTPNDLGFNGGRPSHTELLNWLAADFIAKKWSLKELHRTIVTSETYRQASAQVPEAAAVDIDNRLVWRYSPRRLEAEALRDATLAVTGQLNPAFGGPSYLDVRPYFFRGSQFYEPRDPVGPEYHRRSIYRMAARGGRNPLLDAFDCPDPSTTAPKRSTTTTPLQALSLMNNSFTLRMADRLAERLQAEGAPESDGPIRLGFLLVYGRPAKEAEVAAGRDVVAKHGLPPFCRALLNSNGFLYVH
ncbi:MAG: DUF1553 domain-containing protein [Gemmataceae bacterium]